MKNQNIHSLDKEKIKSLTSMLTSNSKEDYKMAENIIRNIDRTDPNLKENMMLFLKEVGFEQREIIVSSSTASLKVYTCYFLNEQMKLGRNNGSVDADDPIRSHYYKASRYCMAALGEWFRINLPYTYHHGYRINHLKLRDLLLKAKIFEIKEVEIKFNN